MIHFTFNTKHFRQIYKYFVYMLNLVNTLFNNTESKLIVYFPVDLYQFLVLL